MKQVQRDSKYIIKRILIGVGIALILANLKKCNVYAEELHNYYLYSTTDYNHPNLISTSLSNDNYVYQDFRIPFDNNYILNLTNPSSFEQVNQNYYIIFYNEDLNIYLYFSIYDIYYSSNGFLCSNNSNSCFDSSKINFVFNESGQVSQYYYNITLNDYSELQGISKSFILSNNQLDLSNYIYSGNSTYNILNNEYYIYTTSNEYLEFNFNSSFFSNFKIIESNMTEININGVSQEFPDNVPQGYSKIELKDNQGVYFVPKNYNDIQIETVDNINFIDFNYYYKGNIKEGWFPLYNLDNLFYNDFALSSSKLTLRDSWFPMYENEKEQSGYPYYAYIIFNNNQEDSIIYYNSILFNSYFVEDFTTYNENICFIDRNNENICKDIDFESNLADWWIKGFTNDNSEFVGEQSSTDNLNNILDILKIPFKFLNSLKTYKCSSVNIPIPFLGSTIKLDCLSSKFKEVLGENFYNIIFYIITGLYAYRITLHNIDTATDILNPNDDKLEVVDL